MSSANCLSCHLLFASHVICYLLLIIFLHLLESSCCLSWHLVASHGIFFLPLNAYSVCFWVAYNPLYMSALCLGAYYPLYLIYFWVAYNPLCLLYFWVAYNPLCLLYLWVAYNPLYLLYFWVVITLYVCFISGLPITLYVNQSLDFSIIIFFRPI